MVSLSLFLAHGSPTDLLFVVGALLAILGASVGLFLVGRNLRRRDSKTARRTGTLLMGLGFLPLYVIVIAVFVSVFRH